MYRGRITDIQGIRVGHATDDVGQTGVTAVLCPPDTVGGVSVRGAAPGTRETDLLSPCNTVEHVNAVLLCGGSAFGLDAAGGAMRYLEEQGVGYRTGFANVPIVPAAVLYDLGVGDAKARPDAKMGYAACQAAGIDFLTGRVGAGRGATVGKMVPLAVCAQGGIGTASVRVRDAVVSALIAVNAAGDIYDPTTGECIACGAVDGRPVPVLSQVFGEIADIAGQNTTIGVVATNARLSKAQANRLADVAHDGLALSIRPTHTPMDGDTLFALSCGEVEENFVLLCAAAVEAVWRAVVNATKRQNAVG